MITRNADYSIQHLRGLSTDTKPVNVPNGSEFREMDTGKDFMFDEASGDWKEQPKKGGGGGGGGEGGGVKAALLTLLEKVAYIDENGQQYWDALHDALYPPASLVSISATFNQGGAAIYDTDSLDTLKQYLTVTANYNDSTTETVTSYTLSGTLTEGTSTITVSYGGKITTFTAQVTKYVQTVNYVAIGDPTIENNILTVENGKYVRSTYALSPSAGDSWKIRMKYKYNTISSGFVNILGGSGSDAFAKTFIVQENASHNYTFFVSADKTNWTVSNQYTPGALAFDTNTWYYLEFGYTGTKYYLEVKTGGWDGTRIRNGYTEFTSSVVIYNGEYVGFGVTSGTSGFDGQIDLADCSIYVNGNVVWTALD